MKKLYNVGNYIKTLVYLSNSATAEEIAVFEFDSKETATDGLKKPQIKIEEQKADFELYIPKLNSAVIKQSSKYVIVCVSNSNKTEKTNTQYIKAQNEE